MYEVDADLPLAVFVLAAAVFAGFGVHLARRPGWLKANGRAGASFLAGVAFTAAWAAASAVDRRSVYAAPTYVAAGLDVARYAGWFAFVLNLLQPAGASLATEARRLRAGVAIAVAIAVAGFAARVGAHRYDLDGSGQLMAPSLILAITGLILVEQLFRNVPDDSRWNAKPVCLALLLVFAFDLYLYAEGVLFGHLDPDAAGVRGLIPTLSAPLLMLAASRRTDWIRRLQVSRAAVFYSATLVLVGTYLLFIAGVGYYVRYFGGSWGRALQLALLFAAGAMLLVVLLSGSLRARLRVFVGKNFFSYRYDYREEWLRFTAMLSSRSTPQDVGDRIVRGLANMVESPAGGLWSKDASGSAYRQLARWNAPPVDANEPDNSPFARFLADPGWVIDVDEYRSAPRRYGALVLPQWLLGTGDTWLVVPMKAGDELLGFVTLARPRAAMELNWEVRDLLKMASRQAAGLLAQMQATEALLEARKFEAFNRMSAFVVHDLKNIVTQLSLMLKNAQRLHANPEFQQDMLLTVESSLEKMRRLMLQLREGAAPPGGAHGVALEPIVHRLVAAASSAGRTVEVDCAPGLATRGHEERLERVLGHLVQNAIDATQTEGRVWLRTERFGGQVKVEIGDTGVGMTEDFVQNQLFRPFNTTKHSGMGIGAYESFTYLRELGAAIDVDSAVGRGTVITLLLPAFEVHAESALRGASVPS